MYFVQYYLDCLSQASYMIGDETTGAAVVVDPRRDVAEYLRDAETHGLHVVGVVNTHFHADFLAGHLELARRTGAWIGYGRRAEADYPVRHLADGERIGLGEVELEILETPGHTPESISVVVREHAGDAVPYGVLTGDALFVGDVGRPDLLASLGVTADELGRELFTSVRRLMTLPDAVRVFPAHGAGSACGKNLSTERWSTIGDQRATNHAVAAPDEEEFLRIVTAGQPPAPDYFAYDAVLNRREHAPLDETAPPTPLTPAEVLRRQADGAIVLDARPEPEYSSAHLRGSISVPADGRFAETAGSVIPPDRDIVVVADQDREHEAVLRLARIGFDRVAGYLREPEGAFLAAPDAVVPAARVTAPELAAALRGEDPPVVLDVRTAAERAVAGSVEGSLAIPLPELVRRADEVPADRPVVVMCRSGYRSGVAASLLGHLGREHVSDLRGGHDAWLALAPQTV